MTSFRVVSLVSRVHHCMAHSHTPRNGCIRFVFGVAASTDSVTSSASTSKPPSIGGLTVSENWPFAVARLSLRYHEHHARRPIKPFF